MESTQTQNYSTPEQKRSNICKRCGRKLKNPKSIEVGYGTSCYKKVLAESSLKSLFIVTAK